MEWVRVTRSSPCPICGYGDWCMVSRDGTSAACGRVMDGAKRRSDGSLVEFRDGMGYVHDLRDESGRPRREVVVPAGRPVSRRVVPDTDWLAMHREAVASISRQRMAHLSEELGVSEMALAVYGTGRRMCRYTWPMRDGRGRIIGMRTRMNGQKRAVPGSRNGLFLPDAKPWGNRIVIVEGPTDAAACLDMDIYAIGISHAGGNLEFLAEWLAGEKREITVLADRDRAGVHAATGLSRKLAGTGLRANMAVVPAGKDARDWYCNHGGHAGWLEWVAAEASTV